MEEELNESPGSSARKDALPMPIKHVEFSDYQGFRESRHITLIVGEESEIRQRQNSRKKLSKIERRRKTSFPTPALKPKEPHGISNLAMRSRHVPGCETSLAAPS